MSHSEPFLLPPPLSRWLAPVFLCIAASLSAAAPKDGRPVDFVRDVQPILAENCYGCHGPSKQENSLRWDVKQVALSYKSDTPLIVPGASAKSRLIHVVSGHDPSVRMPAEGEPLTAEQVGVLRAWIDQGADWPDSASAKLPNRLDHWSFQPLKRPGVPESAAKTASAIDAFVGAALREKDLSPSPEADRRTLIRRLSFDLIGLPPSPEEVEAFVHDPDPDAYEKLVDRLLDSPRYGERWARHWLDVVRFAESNGFETNVERPNAWHYRDYVIRSLNEDKPFDQFVREQMAGDFYGVDEATGFLVGGAWDEVKSPDPVLTATQRSDELHDMVSTVGSAFLGLTVGCARCHDHKFDPISQTDYFRFVATVAGVQHGERAMRKRQPPNDPREAQIAAARERLGEIETKLAAFEPLANPAVRFTLVPDAQMTELVPALGREPYRDGTERGQRNDPGGADRLPNLGRGYFFWNNVAGQDVFAWTPQQAGRHRIWLSWGCGWNTHAPDAAYFLDHDGDLATTDDRNEIARVDQSRFAHGSGDVMGQPLWSGFHDAGIHELGPQSRIILRGGETEAYVSADVLLLESIPQGESSPGKSNVPRVRPGLRISRNVDRIAPVSAKRVRFTVLQTTDFEPCIDELEIYTTGDAPRNAALASAGAVATASSVLPGVDIHKIEHLNDGLHGNSNSWISNEPGKGWVQIEFPEVVTIDRIVWGRDRQEQFRDRLPMRYTIEVATDGDNWQFVATGDDRLPFALSGPPEPIRLAPAGAADAADELSALLAERQALDQQLKQAGGDASGVAYAGKFVQPGQTHRLHRGDPMQPKETVAPGALASVGRKLDLPEETPEQERRVKLAEWITDPQNPLTARVIVNRLWHYHFGRGIVETPSDFGRMGAKPTHPELLDWLASELLENEWRLKPIHRLIVLSATYRQSSASNPAAEAIDAGNTLLWRYPPRRLEAEAIRDAILSVCGNLDVSRVGGPPFSVFKPNTNYVRVYEPLERFTDEGWRRMIYHQKIRSQNDGTFGAFDCPDGAQIAPRRPSSTTPLQALNLLNGAFLLQQADIFANRLRTEAANDANAQVKLAFNLALSRDPSPTEQGAAVKLIAEHGVEMFCRALLNANEFIYVY